jgi:beta-lactamase class A
MSTSFILQLKNLAKKHERTFIALLGVSIGITFSNSFYDFTQEEKVEITDKRQGLNGFINPILECASSGGYGLKTYAFDKKLQTYISSLTTDHKEIKQISLHFKDLNNGPEISIGGNIPILGGSLLKVPLMIGYLKISEDDPGYLQRKIQISEKDIGELYKVQGITPQATLKQGQSYSLDELIASTIIDSDNVAAVILENYDQNRSLKMVTNEMDISISPKFPPYREMSIKDYSGFFRVLYNSSYLDRAHSNRALEILSQVNFKEGLRAGVPSDITISHKFGEKISETDGQTYFNDCGIIYHPKKPYLLCISTLGNDIKIQMDSVTKISTLVFNEVDKM